LSLVDTYDTLKSGVLNYIIVGWALYEIGYKPIGIRLDSGDLAYLSKSIRQLFIEIDQTIGQPIFASNNIVASNDLNEEVILSLNRQGHEIDTFGVGTNLVTCLSQPALGCVYKLVEIDGNARIKLSEEVEKLVIPGKKSLYRLYGRDGHPLLDLMQKATEDPPEVGQRILVRHPFKENKRAYVTAAKVENLLQVVWDGTQETLTDNFTDLNQNRERCQKQISLMRPDHIRSINATPYKTSVTESLYNYIHQLWLENIPVNELN
jgi:nicotinate phosphoribosyltransferase